MLGAGRYDRKIAFKRVTITKAGVGTEKEVFADWSPPLLAMATVSFGSAQERRDAGSAEAQQMATFRVRSMARYRTVTERDAIFYGGAHWGITGIVEVGPRAEEIEFTAARRR